MVYLPNPDYLEVGKFKLQRNVDYFKAGDENIDSQEMKQRYRQNYDQVIQVGNLQYLIKL